MKKLIAMLLSLVMILSLFAGCGNDKPAASEAPKAAEESKAADATNAPVKPVVIKYSTAESPTSVLAQVMTDLIAEVDEKSNGTIIFEPYYSNELGSLADVTEQMTLGGNLMANASGDFYATYGCPDILSSALFYAVPDKEALQKLNASDLFASWCDQIEEASGINSVADIKGLKIRVPGTAADAFFSALGASTMSMPFSEVYSNLDSGMIEAAEAALGGLYDYALHEVAKYVFLSEHSLAPACVAISSSVWNELTPENQKILKDALVKYGDIYTQKCLDLNDEYRAKMEEAGVTFVEPSAEDIEAMKAAGAASFAAFPELSDGLAEKLAAAIS